MQQLELTDKVCDELNWTNLIKPDSNDMLSYLNYNDINELIDSLNHFYLTLRSYLNFEDSITFGFEIEFEHAKVFQIKKELQKKGFVKNGWNVADDNTLNSGAEIDSPILCNNEKTWEQLQSICSLVQKYASVGRYTGSHIHVGSQILGCDVESWINLFDLWSGYENVIFRFYYGEYLCERYTLKDFAKPIAQELERNYQNLMKFKVLEPDHILLTLRDYCKTKAINFSNIKEFTSVVQEKNTIELRCPNGTLEPVIWQNNLNLFVHLLNYVKSEKYNPDIIENRKRKNKDRYGNLDWYNQIQLQQSLEFADMIFPTNLDKMYFLRQYLKSFEIGHNEMQKATPFIKVKK